MLMIHNVGHHSTITAAQRAVAQPSGIISRSANKFYYLNPSIINPLGLSSIVNHQGGDPLIRSDAERAQTSS